MPQVKLLDPSDSRRRLDRYDLIGEIASGGMASVFLARLGGVGGFQRFFAIKRLHPHLACEDDFIQMFLDEARLAAGIHHPHVVPILEVGTTEAGYYLVMEYIEGDTLARVLARAASGGAKVSPSIVARILLDALAGLHAAHELVDPAGQPLHLVHRDCSPQNILVGVDGCTRITDFGVARASSRLSSSRSDRMKGKLAYMSPEQTKGGEIDRRADLFAMGTVLWEALANRRLFKADSEGATLSRIMAEPIPRLRDAAPAMPAALDAVCAAALQRDPARRWQTAAEMADALERAAREALPDGVASPRQVAAYVQQLLGQEIAAQRESVRVWLQHESSAAEPSGRPRLDPLDRRPSTPAPPSVESSTAKAKILPVSLPEEPPSDALVAREPSVTPGSMAVAARLSLVPVVQPRRGRSFGWIAAVAAVVVLVGGGVTLWTALRGRPAEPAAAAAPAPVTAAAAVTATAAATETVTAPAAPTDAATATAAATAPAAVTATVPVTEAATAVATATAAATAIAPKPAGPRPAATPAGKAKPAAPASDLANPYR